MSEISTILEHLDKPLSAYITEIGKRCTNISFKLRAIIADEARALCSLIGGSLTPNYGMLETACHLCLPNEPEDITTTTALSTLLGTNVFLRCSNVRVNSFGYPRGLILQGKKYPFLKNDYEQNGVYFAAKLSGQDLDRIRSRIPSSVWMAIFEEIKEKILDADYYWQQLAILNYQFYRYLTGQSLVFIPLEAVTSRLLVINLENKGFIHDILTDKQLRDDITAYFWNVRGCWGDVYKGTFLLFAKNHKNDLVSVRLEGDKLVGINRDLEIRFDVDHIRELILQGKLIPSTFTSLSLLLQEGATLVGGYFQFDYLKKYIEGLKSLVGLKIENSQNRFGCGFVAHPHLNIESILFEQFKFMPSIFEQVTLGEALLNNMSTLRGTVTPDNELSLILQKL